MNNSWLCYQRSQTNSLIWQRHFTQSTPGLVYRHNIDPVSNIGLDKRVFAGDIHLKRLKIRHHTPEFT